MAPLSATAVCILCAAQPSASPEIAQWQSIIAEASARFAIPADWIARMMQAESGGRITLNGRPIISVAGAMGLMQVMPPTYADMRAKYGLGPNPFNPHDNILAGAAYLRAMYERYGYPNLFAAYHAGPRRFNDFLLHRQPLPQATIDYANSIVPGSFADAGASPTALNLVPQKANTTSSGALFFVLEENGPAINSSAALPSASHSLFVPLSSRTP